MEKELGFGCCFSLLHSETFSDNVNNSLFLPQQQRPLKWPFSFFIFFLPVTKSSIWTQGKFPAGKSPSRTYTTQGDGCCAPVFCYLYTTNSGSPLCVPWASSNPTSHSLHPPSGYHRNAGNLYPKIMRLGWFLHPKVSTCNFPELGTFWGFLWQKLYRYILQE